MCREGWQGICQSLQSTPRCDLKGHGVFKGVMKRRKIPGEEEGKQRRSVEGYQRIARVIVRGKCMDCDCDDGDRGRG